MWELTLKDRPTELNTIMTLILINRTGGKPIVIKRTGEVVGYQTRKTELSIYASPKRPGDCLPNNMGNNLIWEEFLEQHGEE